MVAAAKLSQILGLLGADNVGRVESILARAHLPVALPALGADRYLELMGHDKKVEGGKLRFILLRAIGEAYLTADVGRDALLQALAASVSHD
jgi:3-dehydroquinate synthetase